MATSDSCSHSAVSPRHLPTIGFDVDAGKINKLFQANDNPGIAFTDNPEEIGSTDFIIIAVPTPVTKSKDPDLSCIESAARTATAQPFSNG